MILKALLLKAYVWFKIDLCKGYTIVTIAAIENLKSSTFQLCVLAAIFGLHGLAYELSYFMVFGLNGIAILSWKHLICSGFLNLAWLFAMFFILSMLKKFFSKDIKKDDYAEFQKIASNTGFDGSLQLARVTTLLCFVYWIITVTETHFKFMPTMGMAYSWMLIYTLTAFSLTLFQTPKQSLLPVIFVFIASTMMCLSAGGFAHARISQTKNGEDKIIRNDFIVTIEKKGDGYVATPKKISLPFFFDKVIEKIETSLN